MVSAEQKASELFFKYLPLVYCFMGSGMLSNDYDFNVATSNAKKCCHIAIDEIWARNPSDIVYWTAVKNLVDTISPDKVKKHFEEKGSNFMQQILGEK